MDVEQPKQADLDPASTFEGVEEPEELIEDAALIAVEHRAAQVAAFYCTLTDEGVEPKHAYRLTSQWLDEG